MYPLEMPPLSQAPIAIIYNLSNMSGVGTDAKVEVAVTYLLMYPKSIEKQLQSCRECKAVVKPESCGGLEHLVLMPRLYDATPRFRTTSSVSRACADLPCQRIGFADCMPVAGNNNHNEP